MINKRKLNRWKFQFYKKNYNKGIITVHFGPKNLGPIRIIFLLLKDKL